MFKPMGGAEGVSGGGMMFASALKMLGVDPAQIEGISKGLLFDLKDVAQQLKTVQGFQAEQLARQEFTLRTTEASPGSEHPNAWVEYVEWRRKELAGHDGTIGGPANGGGHSDPAPGDATPGG